jgi:hypothetical protein
MLLERTKMLALVKQRLDCKPHTSAVEAGRV